MLDADIKGQFDSAIPRNCDAGAEGMADIAGLELLAARIERQPADNLGSQPSRTVVILGQPAGVPAWTDAYGAIGDALALTVPASASAADVVRQYLYDAGPAGDHIFWRAYSTILPAQPPLAYVHLANLAAMGIVDLVLSTSWDPLLDIAFSKVLQPPGYRVITRGELADRDFARAVLERGIPQIVKLDGDLHSSLVTRAGHERASFCTAPTVADALRQLLTGALVIADVPTAAEPDQGMASLLALSARVGSVCAVGTAIRGTSCSDWFGQHTRVTDQPVTDLDIFMIELDRQAELAARRRSGRHSELIEHEMITSVTMNAAPAPAESVSRYVQAIADRLTSAGVACLAYVDDPLAPGGAWTWRRMARTPLGALPQVRIPVVTEGGNRLMGRRAVVPAEADIPAGTKVGVIDSAAFSGNTLRLAADALTSRFKGIEVIPAVLVAARSLAERAKRGEEWIERLVYAQVTDRHEVAFPWGTAYATGTIVRKLEYGARPRSVEIFQRPWGTGEVFATSENCSVRLLTINAAQKLSFQRHACRDELFMALDDGVGVDLSADELSDGIASEFDSRIESVTLARGDYLLVPRGVWHRTRGSATRVRVLEVGFGVYDEEFDIERMLDSYGRADRTARPALSG